MSRVGALMVKGRGLEQSRSVRVWLFSKGFGNNKGKKGFKRGALKGRSG